MMTFNEMSHYCNLAGCKLTETEDTLRLEFPYATIEIRKDFVTAKTQQAFFVTSGWLPTFRKYIDNNKEASSTTY